MNAVASETEVDRRRPDERSHWTSFVDVCEVIVRWLDDALNHFLIALAAWVLAYHATVLADVGLTTTCVFAALLFVLAEAGWFMWVRRVDREPALRGSEAVTLVALSLVAAVAAAVIRRPDADDVAYVGFSRWVAERGVVPRKEFLFTEYVGPGDRPLVASAWETLLGSIARVTRIDVGDVTWLLAAPILSALAIAALARFMRVARVPLMPVAMVGAVVFLFSDAAAHAAFGNLHLARIWQGKILIPTILVPVIYAAMASRLEKSSRRDATALLLASSVVVTGVSGTAYIVLPLLTLVGTVVALAYRRWISALQFAAVAVYPMLMFLLERTGAFGRSISSDISGASGAAMGALGLTKTAATTHLRMEDVVLYVLGASSLRWCVVGVLVVGGALALKSGAVRALTVVSLLVAAVAASTLAQELLHSISGAGPILWRVVWVVPVLPLVGAAIGAACAVSFRVPPSATPRPVRAGVCILVVGAALAMVVATGRPLWSTDNGAHVATPSWKLDPAALGAARIIASHGATHYPGRSAAAPDDVVIALSTISSFVHPTIARHYALPDTMWHPQERALMRAVVMGEIAAPPADQVRRAIEVFHVSVVCVVLGGEQPLEALQWRPVALTERCTLYEAPPAAP